VSRARWSSSGGLRERMYRPWCYRLPRTVRPVSPMAEGSRRTDRTGRLSRSRQPCEQATTWADGQAQEPVSALLRHDLAARGACNQRAPRRGCWLPARPSAQERAAGQVRRRGADSPGMPGAASRGSPAGADQHPEPVVQPVQQLGEAQRGSSSGSARLTARTQLAK